MGSIEAGRGDRPFIRRGLRPRHLLHGGKERERMAQPRRGHAAETDSASQLAISSVPPVGAAKGNSPWPAYWRSVRSPANKAAAMTKPNPATIPNSDVDDRTFRQHNGPEDGGQHETAASMTPRPSRGVRLMRRGRRQHHAIGAHHTREHDQDAQEPAPHLRSSISRTIAARNSGMPAPEREEVTSTSGKAAGCFASAAVVFGDGLF